MDLRALELVASDLEESLMPAGTGIDWDNQPLGTMSDEKLALHLGTTRQTVADQRRKRGIPAFHARPVVAVEDETFYAAYCRVFSIAAARPVIPKKLEVELAKALAGVDGLLFRHTCKSSSLKGMEELTRELKRLLSQGGAK